MAECKDCVKQIFNGETSDIGLPQCNDNCGSETNCEGIQTFTDCINVNPALSCADTEANATLSDVLIALDEKICETQTSNCSVKVSSDDTCCSTLESKITVSTGLTKSTTNPGGCEALNIAISCPQWNNLTPNASTKWSNKGAGFQTLQYSTVVGCVVKVRGVVKNGSYTNLYNLVATLPVGHRPLLKRVFGGYTYFDTTTSTYKAGGITIDTDGSIYVSISGSGSYQTVPIELTFETN